MNNYHIFYVAFLVIIGVGVLAVTSIDFDDEGSCKKSTLGNIKVRQPNTETFVDKVFCIIIKT